MGEGVRSGEWGKESGVWSGGRSQECRGVEGVRSVVGAGVDVEWGKESGVWSGGRSQECVVGEGVRSVE